MVPPRVLKTINKHIRIPRNAYQNQNTTMFYTQNDITSYFIGFSSNATQKQLINGYLMIGNNNEKDLISLLETVKGTQSYSELLLLFKYHPPSFF